MQFKWVAYNAITHHEAEPEDEGNDGAPPGVRVLVLVEVGEERLEVVGVGDALALEELLARGLRAVEEEANGVRWQLKDKQFMLIYHSCSLFSWTMCSGNFQIMPTEPDAWGDGSSCTKGDFFKSLKQMYV